MPPFGPISRPRLVRALRAAGFYGPFAGTKHQFITRGDVSVRIPNPHRGDIGKHLLAELLRQAGISRKEWEKLD